MHKICPKSYNIKCVSTWTQIRNVIDWTKINLVIFVELERLRKSELTMMVLILFGNSEHVEIAKDYSSFFYNLQYATAVVVDKTIQITIFTLRTYFWDVLSNI